MIEVTVTRDQHTIAASEVEATEPVSITPMSIPDGEGYDKIWNVCGRDKTPLKNSNSVSLYILEIKILVRQLILNPIFCVRAGLS